jgi:ATP-dependent Clp protease adaptor protein ClpS
LAEDHPNDHTDDTGTGSGTAVISESKSKAKTPPLYRVILMNDDYTPMDFVILVLQKYFQKEIPEATKIMLQIHNQGSGLCGTFTYEIAETKTYQVNQFSRQNRHPLKCVMERE